MTYPLPQNLPQIAPYMRPKVLAVTFSNQDELSAIIFDTIRNIPLEKLSDDTIYVELQTYRSKFKNDWECFTAALIFEKMIDATTQSRSNSSSHWKRILDPSNIREICFSFVHLYKILARMGSSEFEEQEADKKNTRELAPSLISLMDRVGMVSFWSQLAEIIDVSSKERLNQLLPMLLKEQFLSRIDDLPTVIAVINHLMKLRNYTSTDLQALLDNVRQLVEVTPQRERYELGDIFKDFSSSLNSPIEQFLEIVIPILHKRNQLNAEVIEEFRPITPVQTTFVGSSPSLMAGMFPRKPPIYTLDDPRPFRPISPPKTEYETVRSRSFGMTERPSMEGSFKKEAWQPNIPSVLKLVLSVFNVKLKTDDDADQSLASEIKQLLEMYDECPNQEKREAFVNSFTKIDQKERYKEFKRRADNDDAKSVSAPETSEPLEQFQFTD